MLISLLGIVLLGLAPAQAATVTLTLQADGNSRFFEYFSDAFAQLDKGFNNNPALDGFYLASIWESTGVYQQVGGGADVFIPQIPCPPAGGCTESNWINLVSVTYNGSGNGTFPVTGLVEEFDDVFSEIATITNRRFSSAVSNVSGTVTVSGGQITSIDLTSTLTFIVDGQNFGFQNVPFTGTFTISGTSFAVYVDDSFNTGPLGPYRLKWDLHGGVVAGTPPQSGVLALSASTYSIIENGGNLTVEVNRSGGSDGAASVNYATSNGTAIAPGDYTATSGTLTWAAGTSGTRTFTIPIVDDNSVEGDETFTVTLSGASGASLGTSSQATVTIIDNDTSQPGTLALSASTYSVAESGSSLAITVNRSGGSDGAASVNYATSNGTATAPGDYTATSGTLTWAAGAGGSKTFTIPIVDDSSFEGDETFTATLSGAVGAALGSPATATVTIIDDDTLQPGMLALSASAYSVVENGGSLTITVNRSGGSDDAASVNYATSNGTAIAPGDYTATSGTLTWGAGVGGSRTFTIPITDDSGFEGNETFTVTLSAASGASMGTPSQATVTIVDNDTPQRGEIRFLAISRQVSESNPSVTVEVVRQNGGDGVVSLQFQTIDGTAEAPQDYVATSGTLEWPDGVQGNREITVLLEDDSVIEGLEFFELQLLNPAGGVSIAEPSSMLIEIVDNDSDGIFADGFEG